MCLQEYYKKWYSNAAVGECFLSFSFKCGKSGVILKNTNILIFKYPAGQLLISDSCHHVMMEALGYLYRSLDLRATSLGSSHSSVHGILQWVAILCLKKKCPSGYSCLMHNRLTISDLLQPCKGNWVDPGQEILASGHEPAVCWGFWEWLLIVEALAEVKLPQRPEF